MRPTAKSAFAIVLFATTAVAGEAVAQSRSYGRASQGFVTAESRFGNGTVSGPVRPGRKGSLEVMMPGGTWISCGRSCSETLRVETVDFWENKGAGRDRIDNPCGLFGCLSRSYGF
jgi:hypothetical protein